jgi:hypothetical protein
MVTTVDGDAAATTMRIVVAHQAEELRQHLPGLEDLGSAAMEPNSFYEPWVLFPAIEEFGGQYDLRFVLVYGETRTATGTDRVLCGFFPFERGRRFGGLPLNVFRLWKYGTAFCGLCTPLIRVGDGPAVLRALLDWTREGEDRPSLIEWQRFGGRREPYPTPPVPAFQRG